ncbi:MAG: GNAT family N-acetyltransferase [Pseudomonadota bacterium]
MTIAYRPATAADLPAIDALFRSSFTDTFAHLYKPEDLSLFFADFTPEAWAEEFADLSYGWLLAEEGGQLAGFVKLGPPSVPVDSRADRLELRQIYIDKTWHGRGIAPVLMDWAIGEAKARGVHEIYLTVYVDNHRARRVYDRYGFEPVGSYSFMVGNHADEDIIMRLTL